MGSDDVTLHRALGVPSRRRILELLEDPAGPRDAHGLAAATGLHATTVRAHLAHLHAAGLVSGEVRRGDGRGRPHTEYRAVRPRTEHELDPVYRELAGALLDGLASSSGGPEAARAAGRAWGLRMVSALPTAEVADRRRALLDIMADLGFAARGGANDEIVLDRCPFAALAAAHPDIVCGLHGGVMQGVLDRTSSGHLVSDLQPLADDGRCVVRILRRA